MAVLTRTTRLLASRIAQRSVTEPFGYFDRSSQYVTTILGDHDEFGREQVSQLLVIPKGECCRAYEPPIGKTEFAPKLGGQ